jgi:sulfur carrier protein
MGGVKVLLRNPRREVEVTGPIGVLPLLRQFGYTREAVLVIVDGTLVTGDTSIADGSEVEIRPVVSGGAVGTERGEDARWGYVGLTDASSGGPT